MEPSATRTTNGCIRQVTRTKSRIAHRLGFQSSRQLERIMERDETLARIVYFDEDCTNTASLSPARDRSGFWAYNDELAAWLESKAKPAIDRRPDEGLA